MNRKYKKDSGKQLNSQLSKRQKFHLPEKLTTVEIPENVIFMGFVPLFLGGCC